MVADASLLSKWSPSIHALRSVLIPPKPLRKSKLISLSREINRPKPLESRVLIGLRQWLLSGGVNLRCTVTREEVAVESGRARPPRGRLKVVALTGFGPVSVGEAVVLRCAEPKANCFMIRSRGAAASACWLDLVVVRDPGPVTGSIEAGQGLRLKVSMATAAVLESVGLIRIDVGPCMAKAQEKVGGEAARKQSTVEALVVTRAVGRPNSNQVPKSNLRPNWVPKTILRPKPILRPDGVFKVFKNVAWSWAHSWTQMIGSSSLGFHIWDPGGLIQQTTAMFEIGGTCESSSVVLKANSSYSVMAEHDMSNE